MVAQSIHQYKRIHGHNRNKLKGDATYIVAQSVRQTQRHKEYMHFGRMTKGALQFWEQHRRHMVMTRDVSKFESLANLRVTRSKVPASEEWSELPPQACFETDASRQHTIPILLWELLNAMSAVRLHSRCSSSMPCSCPPFAHFQYILIQNGFHTMLKNSDYHIAYSRYSLQ